jgi:hypothetical protein
MESSQRHGMTPQSFVCLDCGEKDSSSIDPVLVVFRIGHESVLRTGFLCDWCACRHEPVSGWALTKGHLATTTGYVIDAGSVTVISPVVAFDELVQRQTP